MQFLVRQLLNILVIAPHLTGFVSLHNLCAAAEIYSHDHDLDTDSDYFCACRSIKLNLGVEKKLAEVGKLALLPLL